MGTEVILIPFSDIYRIFDPSRIKDKVACDALTILFHMAVLLDFAIHYNETCWHDLRRMRAGEVYHS